MKIKFRQGTEIDFDLLAEWNHQLIADEGHRNPMNVAELRKRMGDWIKGEHAAIIFSESEDLAYALFKETDSEIYLRQFFVRRDRRREGIGRDAMNILFNRVWPKKKRLTVDVLAANASGIAFWRSVGFHDYCLSLEIPPHTEQTGAEG
jgi:GNAT superfamily N-acetyltransferase